jgi:hypothetical protein
MSVPHTIAPEGTQHHDGPRWIPVAAAILALASAVSGYLTGARQSEALLTKNEQLVAFTRAADTYNEYESARIKVSVFRAALDAGNVQHPHALEADAAREEAKGPELKRRADEDVVESQRFAARADRLTQEHQWLEVGTTLFEIAIVLVSITALVGSRVLPVTAGIATLCGLGIDLFALLS